MAAALVVAATARVGGPEAELQRLLSVLPERLGGGLLRQRHRGRRLEEQLVEVVLDLGRRPVARFADGDCAISDDPVSAEDIEDALCCVGDFGDDNRAGIDRTLHRVSAIRNRAGRVVGLTCRVGRAVPGSADMARDLVASGGSLLLMGPPGVGKTTAIREIARLLADEYDRRVVIVDTSNEIAGDGDIPHPGIGRARRMQVPNVELQHMVMIEAVENHMPETIVIDEIGTELEALAAVTIAQRGVQLVATAHGASVDNLIKNPSLEILAGGIQSVTLGDDEARRRGVQKSVLERKGQPAFTSAIEMLSRTEWRIHHSLAATIDALLAGQSPAVEIRTSAADEDEGADDGSASNLEEVHGGGSYQQPGAGDPFLLYPYQVSQELLKQAIQVSELQSELRGTSDLAAANAVLTLRSKLRDNMWLRSIAKLRQLPILAIKVRKTDELNSRLMPLPEGQANTLAQMVRATRALLEMELIQAPTKPKAKLEDEIDALEEARLAIEHIVIAKRQPVELLPRGADMVALQIRLAHSYQLASETLAGSEPTVQRIRILPHPPARQQEPESESEQRGGGWP